jgi:hypothetical protein
MTRCCDAVNRSSFFAKLTVMRLPHREEQLSSALSMVPGIFMALYWRYISSKTKAVKVLTYLYIVACIGSIIYHTHSAYNPGYNPKWLRLDISCQQLVIYSGAVLSPLKASGALLVLPMAVLTGICDLSHMPSCYIVYFAHALTILSLAFTFSFRLGLQCLLAIFTFSMKDVFPQGYTLFQNIWHILGHINVASIWSILDTYS